MTFPSPEDLQIDTHRSGIATPVTVRITHRPTGVRAKATGPSELQAREIAMRQLRYKLRDQFARQDRVRDAEALTEEGMARDSER